jgi:hypothetical protein
MFEYSDTGVSGNIISRTTVSDGYCGVGSVVADRVENGSYYNTRYNQLNSDLPSLPAPNEP